MLHQTMMIRMHINLLKKPLQKKQNIIVNTKQTCHIGMVDSFNKGIFIN